ncbi:RNA-directed DNA polymerase, eukaryota [Artemisia annua]|uniref:RNA-directed DNA polymerase, eukaryota n=1 Tax=Artemisia annua TaxID=35608 RepID=A0A2U1L4S4_ARTAN|nr:RNA-directed DNA polymerase, eukaryota [Artemisia annua]
MGDLPTYYMSLYLMPLTVQKHLESIRNRLFIGGDLGEKRVTWVNWSTCLASKAMGGLGFVVVLMIFGLRWSKGFMGLMKVLEVGGLLNLLKALGMLSYAGFINFKRKALICYMLLNGRLEMGLTLSFGTISNGNKQCAVAQRLNCSDWSIEFRRMPRGCTEESQFTALLEAIRDVRLSDASDGWIWGLDHSGFSVASARKYIDEQVLTGGYTTTRWHRCVPIKVNVFMWRLGLNKLPMLLPGKDLDDFSCDSSFLT